MPLAPAVARTSPLELLGWLRRREVHERIRWSSDHLLSEPSGSNQPSAIGGESQHLWVAYLDDPKSSPDPQVVIHDHLSDDFVRGDLLDSVPLSRYIFDCLVAPSDFHSTWARPGEAPELGSVWSEVTRRSTIRVGETWIELFGMLLVDDPSQARHELGDGVELEKLYEWGTRTV